MFSALIVSVVLNYGLESESADEAEDEDPTPGGHQLLDARHGATRVGSHLDAESMHPQVTMCFCLCKNVATRICFSFPILLIVNVCTLQGYIMNIFVCTIMLDGILH
jgi:hypothetical protein